uniref:Uncharacterized protein n=1 Tax=Anguilla anguilla TaxID=7936 RepID=A0A0E9V4I0_ANGAN
MTIVGRRAENGRSKIHKKN